MNSLANEIDFLNMNISTTKYQHEVKIKGKVGKKEMLQVLNHIISHISEVGTFFGNFAKYESTLRIPTGSLTHLWHNCNGRKHEEMGNIYYLNTIQLFQFSLN